MLDLIRFYEEEAEKLRAKAVAFEDKARSLRAAEEYDEILHEPTDEDIPPAESSEETEAEYEERLNEVQEETNACIKEHPDAFNPSTLPKEENQISLETLKVHAAKAARKHKAEILKKLEEYGVKKVSNLPEDKIAKFDSFLSTLEGAEDA